MDKQGTVEDWQKICKEKDKRIEELLMELDYVQKEKAELWGDLGRSDSKLFEIKRILAT